VSEDSFQPQKGDQMSIQDVSPEALAELFHHYHQALAPDFGCPSKESNETWDEVPTEERRCLVAAARLALIELSSTAKPREEESLRWFTKPGEKEWGC
jgi:hypothetical protein